MTVPTSPLVVGGSATREALPQAAVSEMAAMTAAMPPLRAIEQLLRLLSFHDRIVGRRCLSEPSDLND